MMNLTPVVTWLMLFFASYATPAPRCKVHGACTPEETDAREEVREARKSVAWATASVAFDRDERPLFDGPHSRWRSALRIAALAAHETGVRPRLVRNECNPNECDGGRAFGTWQIHVYDAHMHPLGLMFSGDRVVPCTAHLGCVDKVGILHNETAARVVLRMLRTGGLPLFTGQGPDGKAVQWVESVEGSWYENRPPKLDDAHVLASSLPQE